jgi:glucosamine-6-phosphate deaminase
MVNRLESTTGLPQYSASAQSTVMNPDPTPNALRAVSPGDTAYDGLAVRIHHDAGAVAQEAAGLAAAHLTAALGRQETASVILATGQTQLLLLDRLFSQGNVDWSRVIFFHMDEYLGLPRDHAASFRRYLEERVEQRVRSRAFHYLMGDTPQPIRECERYAALLKRDPIDLCFLGVGNNGHLAFNDPHVADFQDPYPVKIVKLDDICRQQQVSQGQFPSVETMPQYALTLTLPTLCSARRILCLATGRHKAAVVRTLLTDPVHPRCPASILRRVPQATLLLDNQAASLL